MADDFTDRYGLSWFRISFGRLQLKAYTKGEHVLRFAATVHNAKELCCRCGLENFDQVIDRLVCRVRNSEGYFC